MTGMALDKAALAEIKRLYQGDEVTVAEIGAQHGISASAVSRIARRYGWLMRTVRRGYALRHSVPSTPKALELVVHQLCEAIITKLKQMEAQMQGGSLSSEDFERDAKSVGQMVGSVFKAKTTVPDGNETQKPNAAEPAAASDDAERLHREIIERFERIQERRDAEAGSG
jgi:hypothetical protein